MSSELNEVHIVGLFVAREASFNRDADAWDFIGAGHRIKIGGDFPTRVDFHMCAGIYGYGKHTFKIRIVDADGSLRFEGPEKEIDLKNGSMYWEIPNSRLESDGPAIFELEAEIDGQLAAAITVRVE